MRREVSREEALLDLMGEEINEISFVMDYVEVHFNGPKLTCFGNPIVEREGRRSVFPEPGSRDALCNLIGEIPGRIIVVPDQAIILFMNSGCTLSVPLDQRSAVGRESALLHGVRDTLFVW
jgi:hypothetical protein